MRLTIWDGCTVIHEFEFEGDGPDLGLDPKNLPEKVQVRRGMFTHIVSLEQPEGLDESRRRD